MAMVQIVSETPLQQLLQLTVLQLIIDDDKVDIDNMAQGILEIETAENSGFISRSQAQQLKDELAKFLLPGSYHDIHKRVLSIASANPGTTGDLRFKATKQGSNHLLHPNFREPLDIVSIEDAYKTLSLQSAAHTDGGNDINAIECVRLLALIKGLPFLDEGTKKIVAALRV